MSDKYDRYRSDPEEYNECKNDYCDLDPKKICDNCGKCIDDGKNFKIIKITGIEKE